MPYSRPQEKLDKVKPEYRTGINNGDHLHWIHMMLLVTCFIICVAMLALQGDENHVKSTADLITKIVYCIALGGVSSRAGVIAGYFFLSLHCKVKTRTDRRRMAWIIFWWSVLAFLATLLYRIGIADTGEEKIVSMLFDIAHFFWILIPFTLLLHLIKTDPRPYFKKP